MSEEIPYRDAPRQEGISSYYRGNHRNPWPEASEPGREWRAGHAYAAQGEMSERR